jgi:hypothetical protein
MLSILALVTAAASEPPASVEQVNAAIWYDLGRNAMIGSGNWIAALWYNASSGETPDLHIRDLTCLGSGKGYHCSFSLFRDGGIATAMGEEAPDTLLCEADLVRGKDKTGDATLFVKHDPPSPRGGHTQTSMHCRDGRKQ